MLELINNILLNNSVKFENEGYIPEFNFNKVASDINSVVKSELRGIFEAQLLSVKSRFPRSSENLDYEKVVNWLEEFMVKTERNL